MGTDDCDAATRNKLTARACSLREEPVLIYLRAVAHGKQLARVPLSVAGLHSADLAAWARAGRQIDRQVNKE